MAQTTAKRTPKKTEAALPEVETQPEPTKLVDMLDEILDEIDEALEENAQDFVKNYVQKGGQ